MNLELDDIQRDLVAVTTDACEKFAPGGSALESNARV